MKKKLLIALGLSMVMSLTLTAAAFAANTSMDGSSTVTYPISYPNGDQVPGNSLKDGLATSDTDNDNSQPNANATGIGVGIVENGAAKVDTSVLKGEIATDGTNAGQKARTHGEYQNNTNSCASCHQTHTAASKNLLFKDGVYNTCTACHDGTLGFYNVYTPSTAGTFGGDETGNASMHLPTGAMQVKAAPGGNHTNVSTTAAATNTAWTGSFTCASCHAPHGSYSDRLLQYNPNGIATTPMYFIDKNGNYTTATGAASPTPVYSGGLKVANGTVYDTQPYTVDVAPVDYYVLRTTASSVGITLTGDPKVIVLMKKTTISNPDHTSTTSWQRDLTPWETNKPGLLGSDTQFKDSTKTKLADDTKLTINYAKAYAVGSDVDNASYADISRVVLVKFNLEDDATNPLIKKVNEDSYTTAGYGQQYSAFCASCHTDYLAKSGTNTGVWSKAFRHSTTSDEFTCLKCHYAHGTDVSVIKDSKDQTVDTLQAAPYNMTKTAAENYLKDVNPSSALKRYTNMSVCWKCHTESKTTTFQNSVYMQGNVNDGVNAATEFTYYNPDHPNGFGE